MKKPLLIKSLDVPHRPPLRQPFFPFRSSPEHGPIMSSPLNSEDTTHISKSLCRASRTRVYIFRVDQNFFERRSGYQVRGQPLSFVFRKPVSQEKPEGARQERGSLSKDLFPAVSDPSLQSGPCRWISHFVRNDILVHLLQRHRTKAGVSVPASTCRPLYFHILPAPGG